MIVLGITGSIGMGKSTVTGMMKEMGVPVWDADAEVHHAYEYDDDIYSYVLDQFPEACGKARINREILAASIFADPSKLPALEREFGYLLEVSAAKFIAGSRYDKNGAPPLIVLDVPLMFEGRTMIRMMDYVACVACSDEEQRERVMARPRMTEERFATIKAKQLCAREKMKLSDIVIDTSQSMLQVRHRVRDIIDHIADNDWVAKQ